MAEWEYIERLRLALNMPLYGGIKSKKRIWQMNYDDANLAFNDYPFKYLMTGMFIPSELIATFDYPFIPTEPLAVSVGMMNYHKGLLERMESRYDGMQLCSAIEIMLGMFEEGLIPPPGAVVFSSYMCEDAQKMYGTIARRYNCPSYFLDIPFNVDNPSALNYVTEQLFELGQFLEEYTGCKMNPDRFRQVIKNSNEANRVRKEVLELRAQYQVTQVSDVFPIYPLFTKFGREDITEIYREIKQEMVKRIENRQIYRHRFRVLWLGMIPLLSNKFMKTLDKNYGISLALEENSIFSLWDKIDEENPWEGLARKTLSYHPLGTVDRRLAAIERFINEYKIDGVIHFSHQGCRVYNGGVSFISAHLKRLGIPFLELSGDILDSRNFNEESYHLRMEAFVELLKSKEGE